MNDTIVTIIGNITAEPELRFTPSGAAVVNFTIASTPRAYDKNAGEWRDGEPLFLRCSAWRDIAENIAESLTRGSRVIAQGRLQQRTYMNKDDEQRTVIELQVEDLGPSLRFASARVNRIQRQEPKATEREFVGAGADIEPPF